MTYAGALTMCHKIANGCISKSLSVHTKTDTAYVILKPTYFGRQVLQTLLNMVGKNRDKYFSKNLNLFLPTTKSLPKMKH